MRAKQIILVLMAAGAMLLIGCSPWEELQVPLSVDNYTIDNPVMGFLPDGKMVILDSDSFEIIMETPSSVQDARVFQYVTALALDGDPFCWPWGSFVEAMDNNTVLVGTSCEIFEVDLTTGSAVEIGTNLESYDAARSGDTLFVAAGEFGSPATLYSVDLTTGATTDLVTDIPGASGGICLDAAGHIYTGNGYASGPVEETGEIRQFTLSDPLLWSWTVEGTLVADVLSGSSLIWVGNDTILVGGGDEFGSGEIDYFAAVDVTSGEVVKTYDPDDEFIDNPDDALGSYYAIKGNPAADMLSAIPYAGHIYVAKMSALGL